MKIIIVGAGITGISTALFLKKYCSASTSLEIVIYESHDPLEKQNAEDATFQELSSSSRLVGGGIGIAPNGMRIIRELSTSLHERVEQSGFVVDNFVFKSARGWRLGSSPTSDKRGTPGFPTGKEEKCVSISRHDFWSLLLQELGPEHVTYKKVVNVEKATNDARARVVLVDQTVDEADLVIGADGVRSQVLCGIFDDGNVAVKPQYDGMIGVGGFLDNSIPEEVAKEKSMVFTFGANGFFGYSANNDNSTMWWSTCQMEDVPEQRKISVEEMRAQLVARHGGWKDPTVRGIINRAEVTQIYPVWTIDGLPRWGEKGLVVVGDAAHALNPTSGQGSSQGLEDARCLALLLAKYSQINHESPKAFSGTDVIESSIQSLYNIRNPRVQEIVKRTKMMSNSKKDLPFVVEMMFAGMLWLVHKIPALGKLMMGDVNKELYYWDMDALIASEVKKRGATALS